MTSIHQAAIINIESTEMAALCNRFEPLKYDASFIAHIVHEMHHYVNSIAHNNKAYNSTWRMVNLKNMPDL